MLESSLRVAAAALLLAAMAAGADEGCDLMAGPPEIPNLPGKEQVLSVVLPVCNTSESAASGPVSVSLVVKKDSEGAGGGPLLDTSVDLSSIGPGECADPAAKFSVTLRDSGGYDFTFEVDPDEATGDTNHDNNHGYKHVVAM